MGPQGVTPGSCSGEQSHRTEGGSEHRERPCAKKAGGGWKREGTNSCPAGRLLTLDQRDLSAQSVRERVRMCVHECIHVCACVWRCVPAATGHSQTHELRGACELKCSQQAGSLLPTSPHSPSSLLLLPLSHRTLHETTSAWFLHQRQSPCLSAIVPSLGSRPQRELHRKLSSTIRLESALFRAYGLRVCFLLLITVVTAGSPV